MLSQPIYTVLLDDFQDIVNNDFRNIGKKFLNVKSGHTHEALADH